MKCTCHTSCFCPATRFAGRKGSFSTAVDDMAESGIPLTVKESDGY